MGDQEAAVRRTALVTGANRGMEFEVCRQLGRRGLRVVLAGRDGAAVAEAAAGLRMEGLEVIEALLDVRREGAADSLAARLRGAGVHVDVLVNNAGIFPPGTLLETPPGTFREVVETDFMGAV
jgi:NAD(P)-dependent dehydrogenase (short-subunit alcohol dehydrogenase family)